MLAMAVTEVQTLTAPAVMMALWQERLALPAEWPSVSESELHYSGWVLWHFHMLRNKHDAGKKANDMRGKGKAMIEIIQPKMIVE